MQPKRSFSAISAADLRPDGNIFNIMRLVLASAVIWSHSYALLGMHDVDPSLDILPFPISRLAVLMFFTLSGFLVVPGLMRRGVGSFAQARALRLLPGLWVMLVVTSVMVLAAFSNVPAQANHGLWEYLGRNLLVQNGGYSIDGAFAGNPEPNLVNGSLWTISREVQCYIMLAIIGSLGLLRDRRLLLIMWIAGTIIHMALPKDIIPFFTELRWLGISFFAGVLMAMWHDRLPVSVPLAILLLVAAMALAPSGAMRELAVALAAAYALITAGITAPKALKQLSSKMPDYSYGIYIYAFPAQQIAIASGVGTTPAANMALGFAIALPFAIASWHFIEKPALALKSRTPQRREARPQAGFTLPASPPRPQA